MWARLCESASAYRCKLEAQATPSTSVKGAAAVQRPVLFPSEVARVVWRSQSGLLVPACKEDACKTARRFSQSTAAAREDN